MFQVLADSIGFPVDQVRYITLLFLSYPLAYGFRYVLHPSQASLLSRHLFSISFGLLFGFLCFGMQMFILLGVVGVSYALLKTLPASMVQRYTMVWAMGSLSAVHYYRLVTEDYGGWRLDVDLPLMMIVQKVTLVAFALHDGKARKDSSLSEDQRAQKIDVCPSLLEYFTYNINFHSLLVGPTCTIKEFVSFMDGSNLKPPSINGNHFVDAKEHAHIKEPSATYAVVSKLIYCLLSMAIHVFLSQYLTKDSPLDPQYSFLGRIAISEVYTMNWKCRYYIPFLLGDSITNLAGLGFNGYDKMGNPKWDLVSNVFVWEIETATSFRTMINNWNVSSARWLRRVCYERMTISPTIATYILSAWWHGFYPGYYLCFLYLGVLVEASRKLRRLVRPYFQSSLPLKMFYDFLTMILAHLVMYPGIVPVEVKSLSKSHLYWSYWYYVPQITLCVVLFLFPSGKSSPLDKKDKVESIKQAGTAKEFNTKSRAPNGTSFVSQRKQLSINTNGAVALL